MDKGEPKLNGANGTVEGNGANEEALSPPPPVPEDVVPIRADGEAEPLVKKADVDAEQAKKKPARVPIARPRLATKGQKVQLLTNHFKVNLTKIDGYFCHYSVALFYEDGRPVDGKGGIGRKLLDRVHDTYKIELEGKVFAYDGEKSLFTFGALPNNEMEFTVVLEEMSSNRCNGNASPDTANENDRKRLRRPYHSKTYKVEFSFAARIPMLALSQALQGQESRRSQEALRILNIILRQHAAKKGCLLVRQSYFLNDDKNFTDVGGGVLGCRGFHSSFCTTQGGISLNNDVSTTMIIQPGPIIDYIVANQKVDIFSVDWDKVKHVLKNLRIKTSPTNTEYKITGLSEKSCKEQTFFLKHKRGKDENDEPQITEITVYDYFVNLRNIPLRYSALLPCVDVGKRKRPTYFPLELCSLVSLQRYTKALTNLQRAFLIEKSREKPQKGMKMLTNAEEPLLHTCGVSVCNDFTEVEGRVLKAPRLQVGNGEDFFPHNGRWNFNNKKLVEPMTIDRWAVVNFSARCDIAGIIYQMIKCARMKGIKINQPSDVFEESPQHRHAPPLVRVEKMLKCVLSKFVESPLFLLCLLPERKNSPLYGPWKQKNLAEYGFFTQCIAPSRINDQYLTNVILKINSKLGGLNSTLVIKQYPIVFKTPTIILGMDVLHGPPGHSDVPSISAVVSSKCWPLISKYRASVRTQSPKVEMIDSLFKKVSESKDDGIMRELLVDFYNSSGARKPDQIIIFRHGVSDSQFNQVLNVELNQIIEACKFLDEKWNPKFVVIIAQKNQHTKFFRKHDNVPAGTVIDNRICHPRNYDFYLCAQAGMIGTTKPTHYHVLLDEVGFSADDLQEFVHSLSYVSQRSTTSVSVVAPLCYAHLAATQMSQFMKFDDTPETSSIHGGGVAAAGPVPVPQLPRLEAKVADSMFFV